jgi:ActR/RegA family two-component response regulator
MKSIIVASGDRTVCETIRACFRPEYRLRITSTREACLTMFKKKRCEFLLIDMNILLSGVDHFNSGNHYKACLQPFWQISPAAEIIVMSTPEKIRDAVMAVKAGARNYITYPINGKYL